GRGRGPPAPHEPARGHPAAVRDIGQHESRRTTRERDDRHDVQVRGLKWARLESNLQKSALPEHAWEGVCHRLIYSPTPAMLQYSALRRCVDDPAQYVLQGHRPEGPAIV